MVSESHVVYIIGRLEKFWKCKQHVDCTVKAKDGDVTCHQMLLSSVVKSAEMKPFSTHKQNSLRIESSSKNVLQFISMLYKTFCASSESYNKDLISTSKLFGLTFDVTKTGKSQLRQVPSLKDTGQMFIKQRNLCFSEQLTSIRKSGLFSDITLEVDKHKFLCHKVLLASFSSYFDAMFTTHLKEMNQSEIEVQCVDKRTFQLILDFVYTGETVLTLSNFENVLRASSYLQIPLLQSKCERFIVRHMDIDNCIDVATLGDTFGSEYLVPKAISYICKHFHEIDKRHEFLTLSISILIQILQNDQINVENECSVLEAVLLWRAYQKDEVDILELVKNIRLSSMLESEMTEFLQNPQVRKNEECVRYIKDFMKNNKYKQAEGRAFQTEEVMLVMWSSSYSPGLHLSCYSFTSHVWYKLPGLKSYSTGSSYGACSNNSDIYICGGSGNPTAFHRFNFITCEWSSLGPMPLKYGRADHGMVISNDNVYMIGGSSDQIIVWPHIDKYNTTDKSYERIGSLSIAVMNPSCVIYDKNIIIFGGNKSIGEYVSSVQQFDLSTNTCTILSTLPIMCSYSGLAVNEDDIYIIGPRGDLVLYAHGSDPVKIGSVFKQTIFGFGTVFYNGKIYILGGKSDRFESVEIRAFDTESLKSCSTFRNMKIPAKKESNQYFTVIASICKSMLAEENTFPVI